MAILTLVTVLTALLLLTVRVDSETKTDLLPHVVTLLGKDENPIHRLFFGSLLNNEWVLSVGRTVGSEFTVTHPQLGVIGKSSTKIYHPKYHYNYGDNNRDREKAKNDLALYKLTRKIDFTDKIQPVLLPKTDELFEDDDAILSGKVDGNWYVGLDGSYLPPIFSNAPMRTIPNKECDQIFSTTYFEAFCANFLIEGFALTMTGSPLVLRSDNRTLIGVRSFMTSSEQAFARISSSLEWIEEVTGIKAN